MKTQREELAKRLIAEQAAQWLCDLREGGRTAQEALLDWLKQSPHHVEEFLLVSAVWKEMDAAPPYETQAIEKIIAEARSGEAGADVTALPSVPQAHARMKLSSRKPFPAAIAAALALLLVSAAATLWFVHASANRFSTATGEQRVVRLEDGSVVQLNTRSRIAVRFDSERRDIELLKGEALFTVARDSARPFRVRAGASLIQALGTQFNVYLRSKEGRTEEGRAEEVTVSVIEGAVRIAAAESTQLSAREQVSAGEQASIEPSGRILKRARPDVATAVAWRERRLVFRGETLEAIAAEFNRYTLKRIRIEGETARNKRLAGTFSADDPESLVLFLSKYDDLKVELTGQDYVIHDVRK